MVEENRILLDRIEMGIGTWAWGDRLFWGFGNGYAEKEIEEAFHECVKSGVVLFDTAEVYGQGKSESMIGKLLKETDKPLKIASKMMPFPWRVFSNSLRSALKHSLQRLQLEKIDLYQMHWPLPPVDVKKWMNRMADVYAEGLISGIGVSNYSLEQTIASQEALKKRGLSLASIQVEYHLMERRIETNGLKDYCRQEGITIIAYSPLAMGVLTGKYTPENPLKGVRSSQYNRETLSKVQPLIKALVRIGNDHDGKAASQVALNWLLCKNVIPIPGVKNVNQAIQNLGAMGWRLAAQDVEYLDELSAKVTKE